MEQRKFHVSKMPLALGFLLTCFGHPNEGCDKKGIFYWGFLNSLADFVIVRHVKFRSCGKIHMCVR